MSGFRDRFMQSFPMSECEISVKRSRTSHRHILLYFNRFYRAEPVPSHWGSLEEPDSWSGGRWGPPYALLQVIIEVDHKY